MASFFWESEDARTFSVRCDGGWASSLPHSHPNGGGRAGLSPFPPQPRGHSGLQEAGVGNNALTFGHGRACVCVPICDLAYVFVHGCVHTGTGECF